MTENTQGGVYDEETGVYRLPENPFISRMHERDEASRQRQAQWENYQNWVEGNIVDEVAERNQRLAGTSGAQQGPVFYGTQQDWETARQEQFPDYSEEWETWPEREFAVDDDWLSSDEEREKLEWDHSQVDYVRREDRPWHQRGATGLFDSPEDSPAYQHFYSVANPWFDSIRSWNAYVARAHANDQNPGPERIVQPQLHNLADRAANIFARLNSQGDGLADLWVTEVNSDEGRVVDVWAKIQYGVGITKREAQAVRDWWMNKYVPAVLDGLPKEGEGGYIGRDEESGAAGKAANAFAVESLTSSSTRISANVMGDDGGREFDYIDLSLNPGEQQTLLSSAGALYSAYETTFNLEQTTQHLYNEIDKISMEFDLLDPILNNLSEFVADDVIIGIKNLTAQGYSLGQSLAHLQIPLNVSTGLIDVMRETGHLRDALSMVGGVADDVLGGLTSEIKILTGQGMGLGQALAQVGLDPNLEKDIQDRIEQVGALDTLLAGLGGETIIPGTGGVVDPGYLETLRANLEDLMGQGLTLKDAISSEELALPLGLEASLAARIDQAENLGSILDNLAGSVAGMPGATNLDILKNDIDSLMGLGLDLQGALSSEYLEIDDDLRGVLIDRLGEAGELHKVLTSLDVDPNLRLEIYSHRLMADDLSSALAGLSTQIDDELYGEIKWQLDEVKAINVALKSIPAMFGDVSRELALQLSLAWEDYGDLEEAINSLNIGQAYHQQIQQHIQLVTPLVNSVSALKIASGSFIEDLASAFIDIGSLSDAVDSLDMSGFLDEIKLATAYTTGHSAGGYTVPGLVDLISGLSDSEAIDILKTNILTAYNDASALNLVLTSMPTGLDADLIEDIHIATTLISGGNIGGMPIEGFQQILVDLAIPDDLIQNIIDEYGRAVDFGSTLVGLDLPEGMITDLSLAIIEGETLETALLDLGILGREEIYGIPPTPGMPESGTIGLLEEIDIAMGKVSSFKALLGGLEIGEGFSKQILMLSGIIGGEEGLVKALENLGIDPIKAQEIGGARDSIKELNDILQTINFPQAVKDDIIDSFIKGGNLEMTLHRISQYDHMTDDMLQQLRAGFDSATALEAKLGDVASLVSSLKEDGEFNKAINEISATLGGIQQAMTNISSMASQARTDVTETTEALEELEKKADTVTTSVTQDIDGVHQALDDINAKLKEMAQDNWVPDAELEKLLTRPELVQLEEAVRNEIRDVLEALEYDPTEYKAAQTDIINNRFHQSALSLARQFGIDVSGLQSGQAQSHFEILESERLDQLYQLDVDVQDKMDEMWLSALDSLTTTLGTVAGAQIDKDKLWETIRQFDSDLELRLKAWGLDEKTTLATIRKINSEIMNNTRRLSFEVATGWAAITGETGFGPGELDLSELGFDPEIFKITEAMAEDNPGLVNLVGSSPVGWDVSQYIELFPDKVDSVAAGFEAMTGNAPTDEQLLSILRGEMVAVDSMPTLAARQVGAELMLQHMERTSKYDAIASEYQLDFDKFEQAKVEADQQWAAVTLDVVGMLGLPEGHPITAQSFREAKNELDSFVNAIYYNDNLTPEQRENAIADFTAEVAERFAGAPGYPDAVADFHRANDQFNQLYGNEQKRIAMAFNLEAENFITASRAVEMEESRMMATWGSILMEGAAPGELVVWNGDGYGTSKGEYGKTDGHLRASLYGPVQDGVTEYSESFKMLRSSIVDKVVAGMTADSRYENDVAANTTEGVVNDNALRSLFTDKFFNPTKPGTTEKEGLISYFYSITTSEDLRDIQADIESFIGGNWTFTDGQLRDTIADLLYHMSGGGDTQSNEVKVKSDLADNVYPGPLKQWKISATKRNWWGALEPAEQTAVMSIISNSTFSPERGQKGSFLSSVGEILGKAGQVALGAWAASKVSGGGGGGNTYNYYTEE